MIRFERLSKSWGGRPAVDGLTLSVARGEAGVDPKRDLMTCRYCGLETLCRVYEKINVLAEEEFEE